MFRYLNLNFPFKGKLLLSFIFAGNSCQEFVSKDSKNTFSENFNVTVLDKKYKVEEFQLQKTVLTCVCLYLLLCLQGTNNRLLVAHGVCRLNNGGMMLKYGLRWLLHLSFLG